MTNSMPQQKYRLKRGTALVIAGPQGCGKKRLAQAIASEYGRHQHIEIGPDWDFQLRAALTSSPSVLIVDGTPAHNELVDIKCMVTNPRTVVRLPYSNHTQAYRSPLVIITSQDVNWLHEGTRRFDLIDLSKAVDHV